MKDLPTIAVLWIGGSLSWLERLCLKSFVDAGQPIVIYTYENVEGIPEGVEIRDGRKILEGKPMYRHARNGSVAPFSDIFRFHLMQKSPGEIWVDTDIYCWRPVEAETPHVFGYETPRQINSAVLGLPPDSDALGGMLEFMEDEFPIPPFLSPKVKASYREAAERGEPVHVSEMPWGLWGPLGISHFLKKTGEDKYAKPIDVYYPVHYRDRNRFFRRPVKALASITENTRTVHLWARIKKFSGFRYGGYAPDGSFLHKLMLKHDIDPKVGRITRHGNEEFDHSAFDAAQEEAARKKG